MTENVYMAITLDTVHNKKKFSDILFTYHFTYKMYTMKK